MGEAKRRKQLLGSRYGDTTYRFTIYESQSHEPLAEIPFLVDWLHSEEKTNQRARANALLIVGYLQERSELLLAQIKRSLGADSATAIEGLAADFPTQFWGQLIYPNGDGAYLETSQNNSMPPDVVVEGEERKVNPLSDEFLSVAC